MAPATLFISIMGIYPLIYSLYISITNYNPVEGKIGKLIWLKNYADALTDGTFWHSLGLTALFTTCTVTISIVVSVPLALLFNKPYAIFPVLRTIVLTPMLITPIAVGLIWRNMMMPELGVLNYLLESNWRRPSNLGRLY